MIYGNGNKIRNSDNLNIKINDKSATTNCFNLNDLLKKHYYYEKNIIIILNVFQTFDYYKLSENDIVSFIEKVRCHKKMNLKD